MASDDFKNDIAFSFLSGDESIAEKIGDELRDKMNVWSGQVKVDSFVMRLF